MSTRQVFIPPDRIRIRRCGNSTLDDAMCGKALLSPSLTYEIQSRFSLPRSTTKGKGSQLLSVSFIYRLTKGSLKSVEPSLTKSIYSNNAIDGSIGVSTTTPDAAYPSNVYKLTSGSNIVKASTSVDDPEYENAVQGQSIGWFFNISVENSNTETELMTYGLEIVYIDGNVSEEKVLPTQTASFQADFETSGMIIPIDTSSGNVVASLPSSVGDIGTVLTFLIASTGNQFSLSPHIDDALSGLNLNDGTVNLDYVLSVPKIGDRIVIMSANGKWKVQEATGQWSLEV